MKYEATYIYSGDRGKKALNPEASDFFYGYLELKSKNHNVNFIDLSDKKNNVLDKLILKLTKLPIYFSKALSMKNLNIIRNSKNIILINESSYFSFLPLVIISRKVNSLFLPMGLMNKFDQGNKLTKFIIKYSLRYSKKILFIGKGELEDAKNKLPNYIEKYFYIPFSVDNDFWNYKRKSEWKIKKLLFIGNDLNRDFELLYKIAKHFNMLEFIIVTENNGTDFSKLKNVNLIKGNWRSGYLKDKQILDLYHAADLIILPLKESTQPSGQSVTLQAMSSGTPVMITKTSGFWDLQSFVDNENIFFVEGTALNDWSIKIKNLFNNSKILDDVSKNGRKTVEDKFTVEMFLLNLSNYFVDIDI